MADSEQSADPAGEGTAPGLVWICRSWLRLRLYSRVQLQVGKTNTLTAFRSREQLQDCSVSLSRHQSLLLSRSRWDAQPLTNLQGGDDVELAPRLWRSRASKPPCHPAEYSGGLACRWRTSGLVTLSRCSPERGRLTITDESVGKISTASSELLADSGLPRFGRVSVSCQESDQPPTTFQQCDPRLLQHLSMAETVLVTKPREAITVITINRPQAKNAVDPQTARLLYNKFLEFEDDPSQKICVFHGANGTFCSGADLKAVAASANSENAVQVKRVDGRNQGPMGPSRMRVKKPVIAAVAGYAVAGGLELSLVADMRIVEEDAVFGVFCRRWGVPLIDGGTQRLPTIVGYGRAME